VIDAVRELSPIDRSSHLPMQINYRASDRAWIVALYNPWGARRGDVYDTGSLLDPECAQRDVLRPRFALAKVKTLHAWPESSHAEMKAREVHVTVGPGGTLVLELQTGRERSRS
jgi:hypothetical protein